MEKNSITSVIVSLIIAILILTIFGIGVYYYYNPDEFNISFISDWINSMNMGPKQSEISDFASGESGEEVAQEVQEEIEEPYYGPKIFSGDSRSVAVMIDNDVSAAWPHAGLNNAYMIYEVTVEGSATRLMAVFKKDNLPDLVGPIRSCRHYFLDYVQEHDAIYCHYGQSTQGGEALKSRGISNINGIFDDYTTRIKDVDKTWHNAFSSKEQIEKYIARKGYRDTQKQDCIIKYNEKDTDLTNGEIADKVICRFSGIQTTTFDYDEEAKNYKITMKNGKTEKPHLDKYTGSLPSDSKEAESLRVNGDPTKPFVAKNILIYQVGNESVWTAWGDHREEDNKKRQEIYNTGSGTGYFITNGKVIKMKWSKPTHASKTTYTDIYGDEITFNDGTTWVEIMPLDGKITIESNTNTVSGEYTNLSGE